jgi:hypothetical protein
MMLISVINLYGPFQDGKSLADYTLSGSGRSRRLGLLLASSVIGEAVAEGLLPATGHITMFSGVMMEVVQSIREVRHVVGRRLLHVWGRLEQQISGQT